MVFFYELVYLDLQQVSTEKKFAPVRSMKFGLFVTLTSRFKANCVDFSSVYFLKNPKFGHIKTFVKVFLKLW